MSEQICLEVSGVLRKAENAVAAEVLRELAGEEPIAHLGFDVGFGLIVGGGGGQIRDMDAAGGGAQINHHGTRPDHAHRVRWRGFRRGLELREDQLGEEIRSEAVGGQLQLMALTRFAPHGGEGHAGIIPQDIEFGFFATETFRRSFDTAQVVELEMKIVEGARR